MERSSGLMNDVSLGEDDEEEEEKEEGFWGSS